MDILKLERSVIPIIERDIAQEKLYGAAVRVSIKGETVLDRDIGVKKSDLFRLASMTKPITAAAVLLETERGRLGLRDTVKKYLPAYSGMHIGRLENGRAVQNRRAVTDISVLHLLTHTSGILSGDIGEQFFPELGTHRSTLESAVDYYPETLLGFEPGSMQAYSPLGAFDVAARIVELTSGMAYDEYLERNIFAPLGICDTGFSLAPERRARLAPMHSRDSDGHSITVTQKGAMGSLPDTYFCAGGGLVGTADDYARFADMLCRNGGGILKPESVALMRTAYSHGWGLGVRVLKNDGYLPDGSFGWSGAYGTHFWVDPSREMYAVYMKNSYYDGGSGAATAREFEIAVRAALD